jgi:phospho-N-acetylmuramoyl-pentapeptide-transferase
MTHVLPSVLGLTWQLWGHEPPWGRAALAAATALLLVLACGRWYIRAVSRLRMLETTQKGDSDRLDKLHAGKSATPTLGGVLIFGAVIAATAVWSRATDPAVLLLVGYVLALLCLGFLDDWKKLRTRKGLRARTKLRAQIALSVAAAAVLYTLPASVTLPGTEAPGATTLFVPYIAGGRLELGVCFIAWAALVATAAANAVNLTDGLDGLATGTSLIVAAAFIVIAFLAGDEAASAAVGIPHVLQGGEIAVVLSALVGAGLGFLWFNCHPAQIFMGDTGSLPLGGLLGLAAVLLKQEILLLLVGGVLVAEALSVILQVASFKWTGKRLFLIAPLHHHFQFKGWPETKITVRFWIAGAACALAALLGLWGRA